MTCLAIAHTQNRNSVASSVSIEQRIGNAGIATGRTKPPTPVAPIVGPLGSEPTCEVCKLTYSGLRTGLSYGAVFEMLWSGSEDPSTWKYKGRHTVLGLWHAIKLSMWEQHVAQCQVLFDLQSVPF